MNLNDWAKEIHENAKAHGWWDEERDIAEIIALIHSELSEALEEYRNGKPLIYDVDGKPEGIAVELADCVIRILDYCGSRLINISRYVNESPLKHVAAIESIESGLPKLVARCHRRISNAYENLLVHGSNSNGLYSNMGQCISEIMLWMIGNRVSLEEVVRIKHEYNRTRPYRHGGKVC